MKKYSLAFFFLSVSFITIFSCKKINEATTLGGDLIPAVDNVNTFEVSLNAITNNRKGIDSIKVVTGDFLAAGFLMDPEFGQTHANFQFGILPTTQPGTYPFKDSSSLVRTVDSVVFSLNYVVGYGDTAGGTQTLSVSEIAPNSGFRHDTLYRYDDPNSQFAETGSVLGSKTFIVNKLKDSVRIDRPADSTKINNVVRILLNNSLGTRLINYDTTNTSNGAYRTDSIFRKSFRGLSIKASTSGNVLTYFDLTNSARTKLTVYYKLVHSNGKIDTLSADFANVVFRNGFSIPEGKSNYVKIVPSSNWNSYLNNALASDDKIYLQGAPSGSYASIVIPALSTFANKVIHRAEIIATKLPSASDNIFTPPSQLFLERRRTGVADTGLLFLTDINFNADNSINFSNFGGNLKNNAYRFNITRYVQGIVTRKERNDTLRIYAPFETQVYSSNFISSFNKTGFIPVPFSGIIYNGRVVLGGGTYLVDSTQRLRLRIIYSNL